MKRIFLISITLILTASTGACQSEELPNLTELTDPNAGNLVYCTNDTGLSRYCQIGSLLTDVLIPNDITIDVATDSLDDVTLDGHTYLSIADQVITADDIELTTHTSGPYVAAATPSQGLTLTGTEAGTLGFQDCAANQVLKRNAGDTAWDCAADNNSGGGTGAPVDPQHLLLTNNGTLTQDRQFVAGDGVEGTDAGANSTYTLAVDLKEVPQNGVGTTNSASGMEFISGELTMLQGCADQQGLVWLEADDRFHCTTSVVGDSVSVDAAAVTNPNLASTGQIDVVDTSNTVTFNINDNGILEADLKAVDSATDEECLTYESTTGDFEWQSCGAGVAGGTTNDSGVTFLTDQLDSFSVGGSQELLSSFYVHRANKTARAPEGFIVGLGSDHAAVMLCVDRSSSDPCIEWDETDDEAEWPYKFDTDGLDTTTINISSTGTLSDEFTLTAAGTLDATLGELQLPGSNTLPAICQGTETYVDTNATTGQRFYVCESGLFVQQGGSGGATAWSAIGDAAGTGSIDFAGFDQDIVSAEDGGDILTIGNSDTDQASNSTNLRLYTNDTNDVNTRFIVATMDEDGSAVDTYIVAATGTTGAITQMLGSSGVSFTSDGDGAFTMLGLGDGSDENLIWNLDDTSNTVVVSSSTGVTSLNIGAISLTTTASLIVADEVYETTDWNGETDVPTKNAIRDKIASLADTKCIWIETPTASDDLKSIWFAKDAKTITGIWCESDQTVTAMLQVDDGSAADVDSVDLACDATPPEDTSLDGDATLAAGDRLDLDVASVSGTPTWVSICWTYTKD